MAEHTGFGFNAADAPTDDAQAVDHRRVRIRAHQGIGVSFARVGIAEDHGCQVFEIDLMNDAGAGGHGAKVAQVTLRPTQQRVALVIALELEQHVEIERVFLPEVVHLDGVVNDEVNRDERVGQGGIEPHFGEGVAHGGHVDDARDAGKVLHQDPRRHKSDLLLGTSHVPLGNVFNVPFLDVQVIFLTQQVLEKDLDRKRQSIEIVTGSGERI